MFWVFVCCFFFFFSLIRRFAAKHFSVLVRELDEGKKVGEIMLETHFCVHVKNECPGARAQKNYLLDYACYFVSNS